MRHDFSDLSSDFLATLSLVDAQSVHTSDSMTQNFFLIQKKSENGLAVVFFKNPTSDFF